MDTYPGNIKRKVVFRNMYLNSLVESECCGCTACEQICPRNCIQMRKNEEGFLYPVVNNDKCIKCGLCEKVCPFGNYQKREQGDICYYGWHKDENERSLSTSGAAFIAISEMCKKKGFTHFYGAAYDSNLCVKHIDTFEFENPEMLRGSKYTQSDIGDTYSAVKQNLKKGEKVLFSGTPCQVDGLKRYLGKLGDENLFLVALVCHGVSSPEAFAKYLQEVGRDNNSEVIGIRFRDKKIEKGHLSHRFTTLSLKNGQEISSTDNIYTTAFGIGVMDRESCYHCPYTSPSGAGDITIGDFWGIEIEKPELSSEISKGISLIIPHNEKAANMITDLEEIMVLEKVPLRFALNNRQQQLQRPIDRPMMRSSFLKRILIKQKKFKKEAQSAILIWKIEGKKKRLVNKVNKIIGRKRI